MLDAALTMINNAGLTVSLDHISFEDVIRAADVSRSTAYRHWPYKDLFFVDVVKELAQHASPEIIRNEIALIRTVLDEHPDWLGAAQSRHQLLLELIRRTAALDFESVYASPSWRTYLALHAAFSSLADSDLRTEVQAALSESEAARTAQIARAWQQLAGVFGYRLRPELGMDFEAVATLLSATMRGLVITALSTPEVAGRTVLACPFGAAGEERWSLVAISLAGVATAFLEPDPDAPRDGLVLADIDRTLSAWEQPMS
jgi:AcrR family transcriptional regulator